MRLRRLLVYTGTSGLDLAKAAGFVAEKLGVRHVKYEDYVEDVFRAPIFHVAELLLAGYQGATGRMEKAFNTMIGDLEAEEEAVVSMHLVYYRRLNSVLNPVTTRLAKLAEQGLEIAVIDYVDDYYHALHRLAARAASRLTPGVAGFQPIDPAGFLSWRSVGTSLAQLLATTGVRVVTYASKHTGEGHQRLAAMLLGRRAENGRRYESAYISHPISKVRARARSQRVPLWSHEDAREIEEFKATLERECPHLIIYSPTTVDELIPSTNGGDLATLIRREDRWPHPENGVHEYPYPVDLSSSLFDEHLYPVGDTVRNPGYRYFLRSHIEASIERRDLGYVAQSDMVIAYRPTMYGEQHMGVETEIKTAIALAKPVYSVVPPPETRPQYSLFHFEYPLTSVEDLLRVMRCR